MKRLEGTFSSRAGSIDQIEETAAAWLARRYGGFSTEESAAFEAWLATDSRHAAAVADLERAWKVVSSPGAAGQGRIALERQRVRAGHRARRRRRTLGMTGLAVATLVSLAVLPWRWSDSESAAVTRIAQRPDLQHLPDGSTMELNAGAEVAVAFSTERRVVRLVRGEALFTVATDARRPFVVSAGGVEVTAVGTAFAVRFNPNQVAILVTKGTVAVERAAAVVSAPEAPASPNLEPVRVSAGQRTEVSLASESMPKVRSATPAEIVAELAWRERRIEFTRTVLSEAFSLFNGHNAIQLIAADARTGEFEISGIFWADDPESFVRLLESTFDMSAERAGHKIEVRKR